MFKEIGLHAQNTITIISSLLIIVGQDYMTILIKCKGEASIVDHVRLTAH